MRNSEWLKQKLEFIWNSKFTDVEKKNNIVVKFKGSWKNKFGHIRKLKDKSTEIGVNKLFVNEEIPEYIIDLTIAHELVHYMHGFHSPHKKLYKHPHKGGVVNKELKLRGYSEALKLERKFVKSIWIDLYKTLKQKH